MTKLTTVEEKQPSKLPDFGPGAPVLPLVPCSFEETWRMSMAVFKAGIVPDGCDSAEKIMIVLMCGLEVGLTPMMALQSIAVINNRPCIWGDGALALVRSHPHFEDIEETIIGTGVHRKAACTIRRRNQKPVTREFTWQQAVTAGLATRAIWQKYGERMLQMRARTWCMRDAFTEVFKGLGIREEVQDYDQTRRPRSPEIEPPELTKGIPVPHPTMVNPPPMIDHKTDPMDVERMMPMGKGAEVMDVETGEIIDRTLPQMEEERPTPPRPGARSAVPPQDGRASKTVASTPAANATGPNHQAPSEAVKLNPLVEAAAKRAPIFAEAPIGEVLAYCMTLYELAEDASQLNEIFELHVQPYLELITQPRNRDSIIGTFNRYLDRFAP